jgi:hypothetical protein
VFFVILNRGTRKAQKRRLDRLDLWECSGEEMGLCDFFLFLWIGTQYLGSLLDKVNISTSCILLSLSL